MDREGFEFIYYEVIMFFYFIENKKRYCVYGFFFMKRTFGDLGFLVLFIVY